MSCSPLAAWLQHRQHEILPGAEVVLDDPPGKAGPLGDRVGAGPVEALLEDAGDRSVDQSLPSLALTRARRCHRTP